MVLRASCSAVSGDSRPVVAFRLSVHMVCSIFPSLCESFCTVTALPCGPVWYSRPLCKCCVGPVTTAHAVLSGLELSKRVAAPELRGVSGTSNWWCVTDMSLKGRRQQERWRCWRATSLDMGWAQMLALWKQPKMCDLQLCTMGCF